jgi:hypothetical protein
MFCKYCLFSVNGVTVNAAQIIERKIKIKLN